MAKKNALGRGLDAIFLDNSYPEEKTTENKLTVPVTLVDTNPDQPRKTFDSEGLAGLADSIAANGLLQPILVRQINDRYEIIAGERRFRASKLAGLSEIPVIITDADDLAAAKFALIENIQREDLNPYEEAAAYRALIDEYDLSQEEISVQVGKSRSAVANALRLLDLPSEVVEMLVSGMITAGHGRALLGLKNRADILPLAERAVARNLSVRDVEAAVKAQNRKNKMAENDDEEMKHVNVNYFRSLESRFTNATGRRCRITDTKNKKSFQIEYRDNEDLEDILKKLAGAGFFEEY